MDGGPSLSCSEREISKQSKHVYTFLYPFLTGTCHRVIRSWVLLRCTEGKFNNGTPFIHSLVKLFVITELI